MSGSRLHPQVHLGEDSFCANLVLEYLVEGTCEDVIGLHWRTRDGFRHARSFVCAKRGRRGVGSSRPSSHSDRSQMLSCDRGVCQPKSWVRSHRVPGRQLQALVLAADSTTRPGMLQTRAHRKRRAPVPGVASLARTGGTSRASRRPASPPGGTWSRRMTEDCIRKACIPKVLVIECAVARVEPTNVAYPALQQISLESSDQTVQTGRSVQPAQSASVVGPVPLASRPRCTNLGAAECRHCALRRGRIQRTGWGSRDQGCRRNN